MIHTNSDNRCVCVVFNTKLDRFLVYDKSNPHKFAIGITIEQALKKLTNAA
ncbi:hypothetical protein P7H74_11685 [Enterococcus devriesei]|uniref:hypothetical protein n=1 Tax=Enterococcus devriesei TaxID=319970 RepID=UPI001C10665A|nr:hypothetical protein [Enterococcus devriesei]MBU5365509.1 hypothetical protein [Enterococcus devriesei]MDT2822403.1 hypothetical protein [Enterococcus devriesei]MDU6523483.1 hypothetical protein [Enterococcus sp.]